MWTAKTKIIYEQTQRVNAHTGNLEFVLERGPTSSNAVSRVWICAAMRVNTIMP